MFLIPKKELTISFCALVSWASRFLRDGAESYISRLDPRGARLPAFFLESQFL